MIDEILQRMNLKYEDLNAAERETLTNWMQSVQKNVLTVEDVKKNIQAMKFAVEQELSGVGHNSKQDIFLKARLRNYMLLEAFLTSPEKAKEALERSLSNLAKPKA